MKENWLTKWNLSILFPISRNTLSTGWLKINCVSQNPHLNLCTYNFILLLSFSIIFWDKVSCSPSWPGTHYVGKNDLKLLILLPLTTNCWDAQLCTSSFFIVLSESSHNKRMKRTDNYCIYFCSKNIVPCWDKGKFTSFSLFIFICFSILIENNNFSYTIFWLWFILS